jgi:hypothetical protein
MFFRGQKKQTRFSLPEVKIMQFRAFKRTNFARSLAPWVQPLGPPGADPLLAVVTFLLGDLQIAGNQQYLIPPAFFSFSGLPDTPSQPAEYNQFHSFLQLGGKFCVFFKADNPDPATVLPLKGKVNIKSYPTFLTLHPEFRGVIHCSYAKDSIRHGASSLKIEIYLLKKPCFSGGCRVKSLG